MKCLVCSKEFEGAACPRCSFPVIAVPTETLNGENLIAPLIERHRRSFMKSVHIGIVTYRWKEDNGSIALDREDRLLFCEDMALEGGEYWIEQKFARIPDVKTLLLTIFIDYGSEQSEVTIEMENLTGAALQEVGLRLTADLNWQLLLKNDMGQAAESAYYPLF